jgi:hypothetical protein
MRFSRLHDAVPVGAEPLDQHAGNTNKTASRGTRRILYLGVDCFRVIGPWRTTLVAAKVSPDSPVEQPLGLIQHPVPGTLAGFAFLDGSSWTSRGRLAHGCPERIAGSRRSARGGASMVSELRNPRRGAAARARSEGDSPGAMLVLHAAAPGQMTVHQRVLSGQQCFRTG